ncbi:cytochrome D ubiquinol oxidase subunit I [Maritimibacter sp. 55A14]|uniref:pyridoxal phosphate-dependent decarboxylase family protein n=1 Tax=Maritimibacter sp. 55A14 TaxID=2174844 RepID=UPI000D607740|nr:pyridoxal-dependent decarboxylase [Maritimibacter sp. 55A14]PWE32057.1 cytochrome D ubiquinol oxidase subunit I [Maritimibacter sp. 55A14]
MNDRSTLDPEDWAAFRRDAHAALDAALDHVEGRAARPVWQPVPEPVKEALSAPLPDAPSDTPELISRMVGEIAAHDLGNLHPRFHGWVHGAGTPEALIPAMFEAALDANLGGREHAAVYVERQVIGWWRQIFDFPAGAGGLMVSGTSMATLLAMKAALTRHGGTALRDGGLAALPGPVAAYASQEAHGCVARAFDILGLGRGVLRRVPVDGEFRIRTDRLEAMIAADRAAGIAPLALIGTAGSVNTGAIDPLDRLAGIAAAEGLWFHVDGAFGAMARLAPTLAPRLAGIERADSIAFDFHKWLHVTYDAGMILIRDAGALRHAFADRPDYLAGAERGPAAGDPWFTEFGPELSRGFRALRVWYQMLRFGPARLGACIAANCAQAAHLARLVEAAPDLELMAPAPLNIVCLRYRAPDETAAEALNTAIVLALQERGLAVPSTTRIGGRLAIRVNLTNHRTRMADMDALAGDILRLGAELA